MGYVVVNGELINQKSSYKAKRALKTQTKEVTPNGEEQIIIPDTGYELTQVKVGAVLLQEKDIVPAIEDTVIEPDEGYTALSKVNLKGLNESLLDLELDGLTFKQDEDYVEILPRTTIYEEEIDTYESIDLSTVTVDKCGASYGFVYNSNGYLRPTNKGYHNSFAYGKIVFQVAEECDIKVGWYQSTEACCDYGIVSQIDQTLSLSANADSGYKWYGGGTSGSGTITYSNVPAGEHFITFKYRKDVSVNSGSDEFRITSITGTFGTIIRNEIHLDATALTRVQINKPEALSSENIVDGVTIMGIRGSHTCEANWVDRYVSNIEMDLSSGTCELGPEFTILEEKEERYNEIELSTFTYNSPSNYKFIYDEETNSLRNNNQNIDSSFAYAKLNFDILDENTSIRIGLYQNSEQFYDYGVISNIDQDLSLSNKCDDIYAWCGKGKEDNNYSVTLTNISAGEHFITIKYLKDSSHTSLLGDEFRITSIEAIEGAFGYPYIGETPIKGDALRKVILEKPEEMISENIVKGKTFFGIEGSYEGIIPEGDLHIHRNGEYNIREYETVTIEVEPTTSEYDFNIMRSVADMYRVLGDVEATWTDEEINETLDEYNVYRNMVLGLGE